MTIQQDLEALGNTANEVAQSLRRLKIRGRRGNGGRCPIAMYLQSIGYTDVEVGYDTCEAFKPGDIGPIACVLPDAIRAFVGRFDNIGDYGFLES